MAGTTAQKTVTKENTQFGLRSPLQFAEQAAEAGQEGAKRKRTFSGTGYSGEVIGGHWYWGNVIFDLSTMSVPDKLPALVDHDRSMRAGYVTSHTVSDQDGFKVSGNLLSNDAGSSVAADSDEGFPWQMSVHITPGSVEEVGKGTSVSVNGRQLEGPLTIFRNSTLSEVSFTATGWDSNTSAAAMSRGGESNPPPNEGKTMTEAEMQAAIDAANKAAKESADQLAAFTKKAREDATERLFSDIGKDVKKDSPEFLAFAAMPQEAFDITAKSLRDLAAANKTQDSNPDSILFSHQANNGKAPGNGGRTEAPADWLEKNATARAEQYSKTHPARH